MYGVGLTTLCNATSLPFLHEALEIENTLGSSAIIGMNLLAVVVSHECPKAVSAGNNPALIRWAFIFISQKHAGGAELLNILHRNVVKPRINDLAGFVKI